MKSQEKSDKRKGAFEENANFQDISFFNPFILLPFCFHPTSSPTPHFPPLATASLFSVSMSLVMGYLVAFSFALDP